MVVASVDNASYPVTGWVGYGVPEEWAAIDMNNFYDKLTHVNLELVGNEVLNLLLFGGSLGSVETQEIVPQETGGMRALQVSANLAGPAVSSAPQSAGGGGGGCFIATATSSSFVSPHGSARVWEKVHRILRSLFKKVHGIHETIQTQKLEFHY